MTYSKMAMDMTPDDYIVLTAAYITRNMRESRDNRMADLRQIRIDAAYSLDAPIEIPCGACRQIDLFMDGEFHAEQITWSRT